MENIKKINRHIITLITILLIIVFNTTLLHSAEDFFNQKILKIEGNFKGKLIEDINGDLLKDIIILRSKGKFPAIRKYASIFLQTSEGFQTQPDYSIQIPDELVLADISDVAGDENPELILLGKGGVYYYRNETGFLDTTAVNFIETETVITLPAPGAILPYNFIRDVNGFENSIIVVPLPNEFGLFTGTPGMRYRQISRIMAQEKVTIQETDYSELQGNNHIYFSHVYPKITFADLNEDGIDDLFRILGKNVYLYYSTENNTYPYEPDKELSLKFLDFLESESSSGHVSVVVSDINNDKIPDISTTKLTGSITNYKGVLGIYFGGNQDYPPSPDYTLNTENAVFSGYLRDFNGDDKMDILVPELRLGIFGMIKLLLMKKMDMFLKIHLQTNNNFTSKPDYDKKITMDVDISGDKVNLGTTIHFDGDIDGDRIKDLVINPGDNTLRIYLGTVTEIFDSDEFSRVELNSPSNFDVVDLDGDKKGEIIATYENSQDQSEQIIILSLKPNSQIAAN